MHLAEATCATLGCQSTSRAPAVHVRSVVGIHLGCSQPLGSSSNPRGTDAVGLQLLQAPLAEAGAALGAQPCYRPPPTPQPRCNTAGEQGRGAAWSRPVEQDLRCNHC